MRVALIGFNFAEVVARLALSLARTHEVEVYLSEFASDRELTDNLRAALEQTVSVKYLPRPYRKQMLKHGFELARLLGTFRPEVVHFQEAAGWTILACRVFSAFQSAKFVLTVHDPTPHTGDAHIRVRTQWADSRLRRRASAVIVHGEQLVKDLEKLEPGLRGRIFAVPHGALGERRAPTPPRREGRFLFFGRIQAYKGLSVLLDAVEIMAAGECKFEVVIAGAGDDLDRHRERIARLKEVRLDERFVPANEVGELFASSDAIVMPYLDATQSGVSALALAAGRAVIVSDVGAIGEVICHERNGLVIPVNDPQSLSAAMRRILDEPDLAERLGQCGAETARGALNWDRVADLTSNVYREALKKSGGA